MVRELLQRELPSDDDSDDAFFAKLQRYHPVDPAALFAPKPKTREDVVVTWDASELTALPPCLAAVAEDLRSGKHAGHQARFALAAFLVKRDTAPDVIHSFFKGASNYKPELTSMQIDSIQRGGYAPPSCARLQKVGLCRMNTTCQEIACETPLSFPRRTAA